MPLSLLSFARPGRRPLRRGVTLVGAAMTVAVTAGAALTAGTAAAAGPRIELRALVVDDGSVWVEAISDQFALEGVPFTEVDLSASDRPTITAGFLADGSTGHFNAVVLPDDLGGGLPAAELSALAGYEAAFGVRQVDSYQWANPTVGLNYATGSNGFAGDLTGLEATATAAARADGFGYLSGTLPIGVGTYAFVATAAGSDVMPAGGSFAPFVTVPIPGSQTPGSLVGVYTNAGVEKMVITGAMSSSLSQLRMLAPGIVSWVTRGTHFGINRNYFTFHYDDAFSYDARWDSTNNCTPTEDCPATVSTTTADIRMTGADVEQVVAWQQANDYTITLPFNGYYSKYDNEGNAWNGSDGLTNALVANRSEFTWLNHGYQHIFQGCVQDTTVVPWVCGTTDGAAADTDGSNVSWTSRAAISSEISDNIARGEELGLSFDRAEYLSGEHSGLYLDPQQPVDNPNFAAALSDNAIAYIGADASRESAARTVASATTIPRHPVAVYYNVSTEAEQVDEYNWLYTTRADGGSGYCEDNPATATCLAEPLDPETGFESYIVPTDSTNDLRFILSNDPRPFYAHVSNLTGPDYLGLQLMSSIIEQYRAVFTADTPLVELTLTEASTVLAQQQEWARVGTGSNPSVTGYVQDGVVTVTGSDPAPITVPAGTTLDGAAFGDSYGGERSGWVTGSTSLTLPASTADLGQAPTFTGETSATVTAGTAFSVTVSTTGSPAAVISSTTALPDGVTLTPGTDGSAVLAGTTSVTGTHPIALTATNRAGTTTGTFTLTVGAAPEVTSASTATATVGRTFSSRITTSGSPTATVTVTGLPAGLTFTADSSGGGTISGRPATGSGGVHPVTVTATNTFGTTTAELTLTVRQAPTITSAPRVSTPMGQAFSFTVTTSGQPAAKVSSIGILPRGVRFVDNGDGTATLSGTPTRRGSSYLLLTATNSLGAAVQSFTLTVS